MGTTRRQTRTTLSCFEEGPLVGRLISFALSGAGWRSWAAQAAMALALALVSGCSGCDCDCGIDGCDIGPMNCGVSVPPPIVTGAGGGSSCTPCGYDCCVGSEICAANQQCVVPGGDCHVTSDCVDGFICDFESQVIVAGETGGGVCGPAASGTCVPMPPSCADQQTPGCLEVCELPAGLDPPSLELRAEWTDDSIAGAIAALPLADDNCDGTIDEHDGAWVLAMSAAGALNALALEGDTLVLRWASAQPPSSANDPTSAIAAARVFEGALIAVCTIDERVRAYDEQGNERWLGPVSDRCDSLAIADLDTDGVLEVVSESQVLNGATGAVVSAYGPAPSHGFAVADAYTNLPGVLEIATTTAIYDMHGTLLVGSGLAEGFAGVGDLDGDDALEIIAIDPALATLSVWRAIGTGEVVRTGIDLHAQFPIACASGPGALTSGGPPVLADVTGDEVVDVGVATARGYVVYDGALLMDPAMPDPLVWASPDADCDGGTRGSTAFDFDGDGRAEVIAATDVAVALRDADGNVLESFCNTAELGQAHPLVLDLDGDGFAELVTPASSRGAGTCSGVETAGVSVRSPLEAVVRTRAIHNEFDYHVDGLMRANPASRAAPDLSLEWYSCDGGLNVTVRNGGMAPLGANSARIELFDEVMKELLGAVPIGVMLAPGASISVAVPMATPPHGPYRAEVASDSALGECRVDNDTVSHYCP